MICERHEELKKPVIDRWAPWALPCICDEETLKQREIELRQLQADIPIALVGYSLETYKAECLTSKNQQAFEAVSDWIDHGPAEKPWIYLYGPTGRGKTGLAVALLELFLEYRPGRFVSTSEWIMETKAAYASRDSSKAAQLLEQAQSADVLVLDDFGTVKATAFTTEQFFTLINHRYNRGNNWDGPNTVITSMYAPSELAQRLGGDDMAAAITWRIIERSLVVHVGGPNLRNHYERQRATSS